MLLKAFRIEFSFFFLLKSWRVECSGNYNPYKVLFETAFLLPPFSYSIFTSFSRRGLVPSFLCDTKQTDCLIIQIVCTQLCGAARCLNDSNHRMFRSARVSRAEKRSKNVERGGKKEGKVKEKLCMGDRKQPYQHPNYPFIVSQVTRWRDRERIFFDTNFSSISFLSFFLLGRFLVLSTCENIEAFENFPGMYESVKEKKKARKRLFHVVFSDFRLQKKFFVEFEYNGFICVKTHNNPL